MTDAEFVKAVNGWKQAVGIIRQLSDGLSFTIEEMIQVHAKKADAFEENPEKSEKFQAAMSALRTAGVYLEAMETAGAPTR